MVDQNAGFDKGRFEALEIHENVEDERAAAGVVVRDFDKTTNVAGIPGWYKGDRIATTSKGRYSVDGAKLMEQDAEPITAQGGETACQRARRLFGLDFEYRLEPAYRLDKNGDVKLEDNSHFVVRNDTDQKVSPHTVTNRYHLLQPDSLDILDQIVGEDVKIDRGGIMKGGGVVWLQTRLHELETPAGPAQCRAFVSNSYDRSAGWNFIRTMEVNECRNVWRAIMRSKNRVTIRHSKNAQSKLDALKAMFKCSGEAFKAAQSYMFELGRKTISVDDVIGLAKVVFPTDEAGEFSTRTQNNVDQFVAGYLSAPGAMPGNLFGLAQAVTYYTSHSSGVRNANKTSGWKGSRWTSVMSGGSAATLEQKAFVHIKGMLTA